MHGPHGKTRSNNQSSENYLAIKPAEASKNRSTPALNLCKECEEEIDFTTDANGQAIEVVKRTKKFHECKGNRILHPISL